MTKENLKILLVESSTAARDKLLALFSARAHNITTATRANSALKLMRDHGYDLVLVNEQLGDRDSVLSHAHSAGLEMELLYRPNSGMQSSYQGVARFGTHKWGLKVLAQTGRWWSLRESDQDTEERYRKLLNRVSDGIVEVDAEDSIRWANTSLTRALGDAALSGLSLEQIVKPSDVHQLRTIRSQLSAGVVVPFPLRLASGQLVEVDPTLRFAPDGSPNGSSIVFRGVKNNGDSERGRELFALYSIATLLSQASSLRQAVTTVLSRIRELLDVAAAGMRLDHGELSFQHGLELEAEARQAVEDLCDEVQRHPKPLVFRNLQGEEKPAVASLAAAGIRGLAVLPLQLQGELTGTMWFLSTDPGHFSREVVSLLLSISVQLAVSMDNFRHAEERLQEEANRRNFYRDALQAVTRGKLLLLEGPELEEIWESFGEPLGERPIGSHADIPEVRRFVEETLRKQGHDEERCHDMALCATEAAGNVVKHAESGRVFIRGNEDGTRIRIQDRGPGIHFSNLPRAVLSPGFSTAPSLGMGYSILLELCDAVHLSTGEGGTSVVLEISNKVVDPLDAFVSLDLL